MNYADSERIKTIFNSRGLKESESIEDADYVVFNSCAVRKKAEDKLLGHGDQISKYKRKRQPPNPLKGEKHQINYPVTIMTGCMVKTGVKGRVKRNTSEKIQKNWVHTVNWLDHATPTKYVFKLLEDILDSDKNVELGRGATVSDYLDVIPTPYSKFQASLPISVGCNHHCTFCTVPFSRGEEKFRSYKSIKKEYENYVEKNYKEIILLGQTVNKWLNPNYKYHPKAYGWYKMGEILPDALDSDGKEPDNFLRLIKDLDSVDGDYWLNFTSSYPNYFTDDVIDYIVHSIKSDEGHINPVIHLAVQSGSNKVLKEMYRHYTVEEFKEVVKKFRKAIPNITITTDIIVGYTTETEEDFQKSVELMQEIQFDMVYVSEYSVRPDTPAENVGDIVPLKEKARRKRILHDLLEERLLEKNKGFIGTTQKVLILKRYKKNLIGKNKFGRDVEIINDEKFKDAKDWIGKFVEVKIRGAGPWGLRGRII